MPTVEEWALYAALVWNLVNTILAVVFFRYSHQNATKATLAAERSAKVAEKYSERAAVLADIGGVPRHRGGEQMALEARRCG